MGSRKSTTVQLGDRFVKTGDDHGRVWTITRLWTATDGLPHARMKNDGQDETRIMSISALVDDQFYKMLPRASEGEPGVRPKGGKPDPE